MGAGKLLASAVAFTGVAGLAAMGVGIFYRPRLIDFEQQRLGYEVREGVNTALQFGCWAHAEHFYSIPARGGRHSFEVMEATLPKQEPHPVFAIDAKLWEWLKVAEGAQNIGIAEGPLGFCDACGLPHDPYSGKGIVPGEGDDFWRTFCAYCKAEIKPDAE